MMVVGGNFFFIEKKLHIVILLHYGVNARDAYNVHSILYHKKHKHKLPSNKETLYP